MDANRAKQIAFCALQLLRKEMSKEMPNADWKDVDDALFSELDIEIGELEEIYKPYPDALVYAGSCFENEQSPKDYDVVHFGNN